MTAPHLVPRFDCEAVRDLAPLYAVGALEPGEAAGIRAHLDACDDPHAEILEAAATTAALLETVEPAEPPAGLKARLMAAAEADLREGRHPSVAAGPGTADGPARVAVPAPSPGAVPGPLPSASVTPLERERARRRPSLAWLAVAAALIVAIGLGGWNMALRGQLADAQAYQAGVDAALDLAAEPGSVSAVLVTADGAAAGLGVVGGDGAVRLALRGLTPTTGTQVYTAWGIAGDVAPVPLGDVTVGADGLAVGTGLSPVAEPGMILALTLEPTAGATAPTLPIVASGVTSRPAG